MNKLQVVVGAQYGSEAKGHVVQRLTERAQNEQAGGTPQIVRVAGPNAGHTGYDAGGQSWALRQVPVAAVTEGSAVLGVAAGSEVDPPVLFEEIDNLRRAGLLANKLLWVSGEATVIEDEDKSIEAGARDIEMNMIERIGSTGKGIGAARSSRLMREPKRRVVDHPEVIDGLHARGVAIADHQHAVADRLNPQSLIIEGTQGYGLGLHAGHYPQCTSSDCRAIDFMAMAGVHPWQFAETEVWAVARMFPIRVAGNSGPLRDETTWEELGLPEERTTVTKKVRRVGRPDWELVRQAVRANGGAPTVRLAITMVDQMWPDLRDQKVNQIEMRYSTVPARKARDEMSAYLRDVERETQAKIGMITTGPNTASIIFMGE